MIEKTAWGCNEQVDALLQLVGLRTSLCSTNDNTVSFVVILEAITGPLVIVHGKLSRWGDDENSCSILWLETSSSQELNSWNHVGERLTAARLAVREDGDGVPVERVLEQLRRADRAAERTAAASGPARQGGGAAGSSGTPRGSWSRAAWL